MKKNDIKLLFLFFFYLVIIGCEKDSNNAFLQPEKKDNSIFNDSKKYEKGWIVTSPGADLKETPNDSGKIIQNIPITEKIDIIERSKQISFYRGFQHYWYRIHWKGLSGWIFGIDIGGSTSGDAPKPIVYNCFIKKISQDNSYFKKWTFTVSNKDKDKLYILSSEMMDIRKDAPDILLQFENFPNWINMNEYISVLSHSLDNNYYFKGRILHIGELKEFSGQLKLSGIFELYKGNLFEQKTLVYQETINCLCNPSQP